MTEHAAVIFVFFFLAEYASIVLICIFITVLYLGGYIIDYSLLVYAFNIMSFNDIFDLNTDQFILINSWLEGTLYGIVLGVKTSILVFVFIWVRASFPRVRFDQLMSFCWTILLPLIFGFVILIPCIIYVFDAIPVNVLYN